MTLRKPCVHDRYDAHQFNRWGTHPTHCPGGDFLPDDSLVLVYEDLDPELVMDLVLDFLDRE